MTKGVWECLCQVPDATRSPSRDIGMVTMSGNRKTRNTGTSARVRKKFQCKPYSVTCSYIHRQQRIQI